MRIMQSNPAATSDALFSATGQNVFDNVTAQLVAILSDVNRKTTLEHIYSSKASKEERGQATLPDPEPFKLDRLAQRRESFSHSIFDNVERPTPLCNHSSMKGSRSGRVACPRRDWG